ncbi:MAG: methyltransferase domain-containing protein [Chlamydiia bacterium]|nr:methyltransferase domain-containing protein [Chlamydiia bacterium]
MMMSLITLLILLMGVGLEQDVTRDSYNATAEAYRENSQKIGTEMKAEAFLTYLSMGDEVLDLGCGPGTDARYFTDQGFHVTGIDVSEKMIEMAEEAVPEGNFAVMDLEQLSFPKEHFDAIWACASLLHTPKEQLPGVLKKLHALLKQEGILYVSLKEGVGETLEADERYGGVKKFWSYYKQGELLSLLQEAGFSILETDVKQPSSSHQTHPWISVIARKGKGKSVMPQQLAYKIIFINGPSSTGKSTLAKALQDNLEMPFLHIGVDKIIEMMPDKLNNWEGGEAPLGFSWKPSEDPVGNPTQTLNVGPFAEKMLQTYKEVVLTLAKMGHYILVDNVSFGKEELDPWRETLKDYPVLYVGLHTPLPILEEREKMRPNRIGGSARDQYFRTHKGVTYDIEFDTSQVPLELIVDTIKKHLQK